jgi:hypothetical protein
MNEARKLLQAIRELKRDRANREAPYYGDVFRFFGSWKKSAVLYAVMLALFIAWLYMPDAPGHVWESKGQAHHVGSPIHDQHGCAVSYLQRGLRTDSRMVVEDLCIDGYTAIEKARGCNRTFNVTDPNGAGPNGPGVRETNCNLKWHRTGSFGINTDYNWGPYSYHLAQARQLWHQYRLQLGAILLPSQLD